MIITPVGHLTAVAAAVAVDTNLRNHLLHQVLVIEVTQNQNPHIHILTTILNRNRILHLQEAQKKVIFLFPPSQQMISTKNYRKNWKS